MRKALLRFVEEPLGDIVQIVQIINVEIDTLNVDEDDVDEDKFIILPGKYGMDNQGRMWQMMEDMSGFIAAFGVNDPRLKDERGAARRRDREGKRKKRKKEPA